MLGPHFKEGNTLAASDSVTIDLPDDDAEAMKLLFAIMHTKHRGLPRRLDIAALKSLAVVVDKYDCTETAAGMAYCWIFTLTSAPMAELQELLHCAYLFREYTLFGSIANDLLLESTKPIRGPPDVLVGIYSALEEERMRVLMELSRFIQEMAFKCCNLKSTQENACKADCCVQDIYGASVIRYLGDLDLYPAPAFSNCSIRTTLLKMSVVAFESIKPTIIACRYHPNHAKSCVASNLDAVGKNQKFNETATDVETSLKKMCLGCVLKGSLFKTGDCSHDASNFAGVAGEGC